MNNIEAMYFIEKGKKVYHIVNGWGVVTSGEYGSDFQVKFPLFNQVHSFKANGFEHESVNRVIYEYEVDIIKKKPNALSSFDVGKTSQGATYIKVAYLYALDKLNRNCACASCDGKEENVNVFIIPLLDSVYCKPCFEEWEVNAFCSNEDSKYEADKTSSFLKILNK